MTFSQFKEVAQKKPYDPFWVSKHFWRHLTIPCSYLCARLGLSADTVTVLSLLSGLAGGFCFCWPTPWMFLLGTLLIWGWWMLDHMDGELARYETRHLHKPASLCGPYLDLLVHRWVQPFYHITLGIALLRLTGDWRYILLGCLGGANFAGFTRTQADATVLPAVVAGMAIRDNAALRQLVDLAHQVPDRSSRETHGVQGLVNLAKHIKSVFAYPGCMVLLAAVSVIDGFVLDMSFPRWHGLALSMTLLYLLIQGGMALALNIAGTWHVANLLRRMP